MRSRSLKLAAMCNTLSISRRVLSGWVSANCSARRTMRRASRVVVSHAAKVSISAKTNMGNLAFMPAKIVKEHGLAVFSRK